MTPIEFLFYLSVLAPIVPLTVRLRNIAVALLLVILMLFGLHYSYSNFDDTLTRLLMTAYYLVGMVTAVKGVS